MVPSVRQRGVGGPAEVGGTTGGDEAGGRHRGAEQVQPVAERVQSREGDVGGADLQRQHDIGEAEHDRGRVEEQHDRAVHGEQLVELFRRQELQARARQLGTHQQGHQTTDEEEGHRGHQVHHTQDLRVGGGDGLVDERPLGARTCRVGPCRFQLGDWLGLYSSHCSS
jgi:hypothetical protein